MIINIRRYILDNKVTDKNIVDNLTLDHLVCLCRLSNIRLFTHFIYIKLYSLLINLDRLVYQQT